MTTNPHSLRSHEQRTRTDPFSTAANAKKSIMPLRVIRNALPYNNINSRAR